MTSIRDRNKQLILRAASACFADKGFAATTTVDIARLAGVPKPNIYYYFKSKQNLYCEVLESIIEPLLQASAAFYADSPPAEILKSYIHAKIRISRELASASKVFAGEIMHGAPHLSAAQTARLDAQAKHDIACIQSWIDQGLMAKINPSHLLFTIWAATQTYADFDWQISTVIGKAKLDDSDYAIATDTITRLVLKGCEIPE